MLSDFGPLRYPGLGSIRTEVTAVTVAVTFSLGIPTGFDHGRRTIQGRGLDPCNYCFDIPTLPDSTRDSSPNPGSENPTEPSPPAPAAPASAAGETAKPASTGGYVPPHLRGRQDGGGPRPCDGPPPSQTSYNARLAGGGGERRHRGPRVAPNINSEVNFPSLGGGAPPERGDSKKGCVTRRSRQF